MNISIARILRQLINEVRAQFWEIRNVKSASEGCLRKEDYGNTRSSLELFLRVLRNYILPRIYRLSRSDNYNARSLFVAMLRKSKTQTAEHAAKAFEMSARFMSTSMHSVLIFATRVLKLTAASIDAPPPSLSLSGQARPPPIPSGLHRPHSRSFGSASVVPHRTTLHLCSLVIRTRDTISIPPGVLTVLNAPARNGYSKSFKSLDA